MNLKFIQVNNTCCDSTNIMVYISIQDEDYKDLFVSLRKNRKPSKKYNICLEITNFSQYLNLYEHIYNFSVHPDYVSTVKSDYFDHIYKCNGLDFQHFNVYNHNDFANFMDYYGYSLCNMESLQYFIQENLLFQSLVVFDEFYSRDNCPRIKETMEEAMRKNIFDPSESDLFPEIKSKILAICQKHELDICSIDTLLENGNVSRACQIIPALSYCYDHEQEERYRNKVMLYLTDHQNICIDLIMEGEIEIGKLDVECRYAIMEKILQDDETSTKLLHKHGCTYFSDYFSRHPDVIAIDSDNHDVVNEWIKNSYTKIQSAYVYGHLLIYDLRNPSLASISVILDIDFTCQYQKNIIEHTLTKCNGLMITRNNVQKFITILQKDNNQLLFLFQLLKYDIIKTDTDCQMVLLEWLIINHPQNFIDSNWELSSEIFIKNNRFDLLTLCVQKDIVTHVDLMSVMPLIFQDFPSAVALYDVLPYQGFEYYLISSILKYSHLTTNMQAIMAYFLKDSSTYEYLKRNIGELFEKCYEKGEFGVFAVLVNMQFPLDKIIKNKTDLCRIMMCEKSMPIFSKAVKEKHFQLIIEMAITKNLDTFLRYLPQISHDMIIQKSIDCNNACLLRTMKLGLTEDHLKMILQNNKSNMINYAISTMPQVDFLQRFIVGDNLTLIMNHITNVESRAEELLQMGIKKRNVKFVTWLFQHHLSPYHIIKNNHALLRAALDSCDYATIDFLLDVGVSRFDLRMDDNYYLRQAVKENNTTMVRYLNGKGVKMHEIGIVEKIVEEIVPDLCGICQDNIGDDYESCYHCSQKAHIECLNDWRKEKQTCIYCRKAI